MEIYIDLKKLKSLDLIPSLYCYLTTLYFKEEYDLADEKTKEFMNQHLIAHGYLKYDNDSGKLVLGSKTTELFEKGTPTKQSVDSWIDDWRSLFPANVKSGGRPVRGDKKGVSEKMLAFVKEHKDTTKDQIFEATKQYVLESSLKNYQYMICADYFIKKHGSSMLAATIEDIVSKGAAYVNHEKSGSNWHKEI